MSIQCVKNFLSNGVKGHPGKVLSVEEVEQIGPLMAQLEQQGLVHGPVEVQDAPPASDVGFSDADSDSVGAEPQEKPQAPKKGKKGR